MAPLRDPRTSGIKGEHIDDRAGPKLTKGVVTLRTTPGATRIQNDVREASHPSLGPASPPGAANKAPYMA